MKKILLSLSVFMLALTNAQASVAINRTNFPDDNFRAQVKDAFDNIEEDDIISDEEMEANGGHHTFDRVSNLKGIELLTSITELYLVNYPDEPCLRTFDYALPNLNTLDIQDQVGELTTVDASKCTNLETFLAGDNPINLSTLKLPSGIKYLVLNNVPLIKTFDPKQFSDLRSVAFSGTTGITDLDFTGHKSIQDIGVDGIFDYYQLNSLIMVNCPELTNIDIKYSTIKSLTFKSLPEILSILVVESDITNMLVDDLAQLGSIEAHDNVLGTLTLNNLPAIGGLSCEDNKLQTLIIDKCPNITSIWAENNKLMWLDLKDVKKTGTEESTLKLDNQNPDVVAVKLSPTETGLLVHERFDVKRVKNLRAKGLSQTPRETTVDGIRYFVFYDNGPDTPNLVGSDCGYEYETKWPYPWVEENSKDNNLPVTLNVYKWTKHQAFLKVSKNRVEGVYGQPAPEAPEITRSQDYDGKITFSSSNESVVKVDPNTGVLTVIGAGTATINVKGAETDYRLAPSTSYTVFIDKATPIISFPQMEINCVYGQEVPLNQLTVEWYEGTVTYSSANTKKATVTAEGVVTTLGAGDVTINGIAPETNNFKRAQVSYVLHIDKAVSPVFAFEKDHIDALLGEPVPENKLSKGLYDGKVLFTSSDENIAAIGTDGEIILKAAGTVTITANGPETENCYQATPASYTLTIEDPDGIRNVNVNDSDNEWYNVNGVRLSGKPSQKGVYIVNGRKVLVKNS